MESLKIQPDIFASILQNACALHSAAYEVTENKSYPKFCSIQYFRRAVTEPHKNNLVSPLLDKLCKWQKYAAKGKVPDIALWIEPWLIILSALVLVLMSSTSYTDYIEISLLMLIVMVLY